MNLKTNLISIALASAIRTSRGHSWVEKVESVHGQGSPRVDLSLKDDVRTLRDRPSCSLVRQQLPSNPLLTSHHDQQIVLQRYFCPLPSLAECQPDPKHGIVLSEENMRPCRADLISSTKAIVQPSTELTIHWAGNGHVGNGQSDGTCVKVMVAEFDADPDFESFVDVPGAECLDFSGSDGSNEPQGTITVPGDLVAGSYTLLWFWDFTEFYYSSCIDIEVVDGTLPTPSPTKKELDHETIQDYLHNGCKNIIDADDFCKRYTTVSDSYCQEESSDECGRSICYGVPDFLLPCSCPTGCPVPKAFYDDFSDGLDEDKWLIAHKSWGSGGGYINGGVVAENVAVDTESGTVLLEAHGNLYTGPVMGVNKDLTRQSTGVRTGSAIATRQYLGAGSYEVRMKAIGKLGVSSAIWTFFYNDDEYSADNKSPIVNHEIDIELPGRPAAPATGMDFDQVLLNTWIGELESLYETGYTTIPRVDDDEFHTWRFDWHTDPIDRRIDFFLDGEHIRTMRNDKIPFYAGRLWIGTFTVEQENLLLLFQRLKSFERRLVSEELGRGSRLRPRTGRGRLRQVHSIQRSLRMPARVISQLRLGSGEHFRKPRRGFVSHQPFLVVANEEAQHTATHCTADTTTDASAHE